MTQSELERHYFISYSRKDLDIARKLKEDLNRHNFEIWMDENDIVAGTEWPDAIQESIKRSIAVLYLVSPESRSSPNILHELEFAKIYKKNIIPLWIREDTDWAKVVAFGLITTQYIDLRGEVYQVGIERLAQTLNNLSDSEARFTRYIGEDDDDSCLQKVEDIRNQSSTNQMPDKEREMPESTARVDQLQRNPYKGLRAFEYKDKEDFFGRKNLVDDMVRQVKDLLSEEKIYSQIPRCMMVVGASGSGKSSVVMAGLLPALNDKENVPDVNRWFFLSPVRPGEHPLDTLALALKSPFLNEENTGFSPFRRTKQSDLREKLAETDSRGLNELLKDITDSPNDRIVLIVDQFEEIFAPTVDPDQREQFINLLMTTATEPDTPVLLLFTLRADFYHRILDNDALYRKVRRHLINIPPMTREELRAVIEKPVQRPDVNVIFDPYLAEDLLYEVHKRPESLPLLQFTLTKLFELRDHQGRRLTRRSYDEIGGLQGAINKHAEITYDGLRTPEYQIEARKLFTEHFIYVLESYDEKSHLESGEEIIRRRVTEADLHLNDLSVRHKTIDAFVKARLLTATRPVKQSTDLGNMPDTTYEISHEALINAWERLRDWIKEDRKDIHLIQSLRPQIKEWDKEENPKKKRELLVGKSVLRQLQKYKQRKKLGPSAEKFFQASLAQQRSRKIQGYLLFVGTTALVILSLVLGLFLRNVIFPPPPDSIIVTSLADAGPGTLPYALQMAGDGATITFAPSLTRQTIHLADSGLDINKSVTIRGPDGRISLTSGSTGNYIQIESGHNVTIENMTFTNSYTLKHSMIENAGNLTINQSRMAENRSYGNGGGIIYNTGNLTLNGDTLEKNTVATNGGAIYNLFGTINVSNSVIRSNEAYANGGGIYSQGGVVTVGEGSISNNNAGNNAGGGIDMVNGSLSMRDTQVESNQASGGSGNGIGGGIAIVGSMAFIDSSVITTNTANAGGGIAVTDDTDNNSSSLVMLQGIIQTDNQGAIHYIGQNRGSSNDTKDIAGKVTPVGTSLQISDDTSIDNLGSPPESYSPQKSPDYLGIANINSFCLYKSGNYGKISMHVDPGALDIMFTCFDQTNKAISPDFSGQDICQYQYSADLGVITVIDRMANYFDPTSLQCYKNLKLLGPIGQAGFANYCASQPQFTGLFDNALDRDTAYDWLCQPKDTKKLPSGLSVTDACNMQFNVKDAIDRLSNFNSINGWECWEPA